MAEPLGISKVGQTVLIESQIWHQLARSVALCSEGLEKGQWPLLTLIPDSSVSPRMPLVRFMLLSWCWSSERMSLSESMCEFFKGNCLELQKFLLPAQSLLVSAARSCGDLSSWHWNPRLGDLMWTWDSSLPRYPS